MLSPAERIRAEVQSQLETAGMQRLLLERCISVVSRYVVGDIDSEVGYEVGMDCRFFPGPARRERIWKSETYEAELRDYIQIKRRLKIIQRNSGRRGCGDFVERCAIRNLTETQSQLQQELAESKARLKKLRDAWLGD